MTRSARDPLYRRHRFPAEVIAHAVWLYFRFPLSLRMVEDILAARGIIVSHQTVRLWAEKFGRQFANDIRRRSAGRLGDKWYLDEVVIQVPMPRSASSSSSFSPRRAALRYCRKEEGISRLPGSRSWSPHKGHVMRHPSSWLRRISGSVSPRLQLVQTCVGRVAMRRRDARATFAKVNRRITAGSVANMLARRIS